MYVCRALKQIYILLSEEQDFLNFTLVFWPYMNPTHAGSSSTMYVQTVQYMYGQPCTQRLKENSAVALILSRNGSIAQMHT